MNSGTAWHMYGMRHSPSSVAATTTAHVSRPKTSEPSIRTVPVWGSPSGSRMRPVIRAAGARRIVPASTCSPARSAVHSPTRTARPSAHATHRTTPVGSQTSTSNAPDLSELCESV